MTEFTPLTSVVGGLVIGLAAVLLMAALGRIAGVTGILAGLLPPWSGGDYGWRAGFVGGLVAAPVVAAAAGWVADFSQPVSLVAVAVSGVLVGVGVTLGSGCTSGHGVCGLARLSPRSLVAVPVFMATAALTVFAVRHMGGG